MKNKEKKEKKIKDEKETKTELIKVKEPKFSKLISKKWLTKTSLTISLIILIIAGYIGINLLVKKINPSDIDLTSDKVYSLSDTSKSIIKPIDQDVQITLINMNSYAQSVIDFAYKYNKVNDKIKVKEVNNITNEPELAKKYSLTEDMQLIIITCAEKEKILSTSDLYTYDYTTYEKKDVTEEAMTNAILNVTVTNKPKIYYLTGHNAYSDDYMYYLKQDLINEANELEELDLLVKGKVPEDCSTLIITTLKDDLKKNESDAIIKYIKKGGKIAVFSDPNIEELELSNFQKVLDQYGISLSTGVMIEQDTNKMLAGAPSAIIVTVNEYSSITNQTNMNMNACFINSGKLELKDSEKLEKLGVKSEILATTSSKAFYRKDLKVTSPSKIKSDEEGSATVGALLTKTIDDKTTSKLIIYANQVFATNIPINYNYALDYYNNEDLALNSISYLTDRDDTIIIRKNTENTTYTATKGQQNIVLTIIFTVPLLIIIAGIIIWQVRRRKK